MRRAFYTLGFAAVLFSGCLVGPDYQRPETAISDSYTQINLKEGVEQSAEADLTDWWKNINDPVLNELIVRATEMEGSGGNLTLREMAWRIQQDRAQVGITRSELFPQCQADGSYTVYKSAGIPGAKEQWNLGTSMAWELDVFGRLKRYTEASMAELEAQTDLYWDAYILLLSEIATQYVTARLYQEELVISEENIEIRKRTLRLTEDMFEVGSSNNLDVVQARGQLQAIEAELPAFRAGLRVALNRLSILTGQAPGAVDELMADERAMPAVPEKLLVGFPAELLRRRPDIRAAEQSLIAQNARIGGSMGDLYPIFSINGVFGLQASSFSKLWSSDSIAASASPGFTWNILNFGKYRSAVRLQEAAFQEMAASYQNTVLKAAEEVDNALSSYVNEKDRTQKLSLAVASYDKALKYSEQRYKNGTSDFQRVLDAQRDKLEYDLLFVKSRANSIIDLIDLYRALGGGWESF